MQLSKTANVKPGSRPATEWEIMVANYHGMSVEGIRVPDNCPAILTKEQRAVMAQLVTPGTHAYKMFTETSK